MSTLITIIPEKKEKYTVLELTATEDPNLSWGAKGLHTYLISRPEDWQIYFADLLNRSTVGKDGTRTVIKELVTAGYLEIDSPRDALGRFSSSTWRVYNKPQKPAPSPSGPKPGKPKSELPVSSKPPLNSKQGINEQRTNEQKNDDVERRVNSSLEEKPGDRSAQNPAHQQHAQQPDPPPDEHAELVAQLLALGFESVGLAKGLIRKFTAEAVRQQLAWLPERNANKPIAFLQKALKESLPAPVSANGSPKATPPSQAKTLQQQVEDLQSKRIDRLCEAFSNGMRFVTYEGQVYEIVKDVPALDVYVLRRPDGTDWRLPYATIAERMTWEDVA